MYASRTHGCHVNAGHFLEEKQTNIDGYFTQGMKENDTKHLTTGAL